MPAFGGEAGVGGRAGRGLFRCAAKSTFTWGYAADARLCAFCGGVITGLPQLCRRMASIWPGQSPVFACRSRKAVRGAREAAFRPATGAPAHRTWGDVLSLFAYWTPASSGLRFGAAGSQAPGSPEGTMPRRERAVRQGQALRRASKRHPGHSSKERRRRHARAS